MIKGFFLPDRSSTIESPIDQVCCCAFDCLHDFMKWMNHSPLKIGRWGENQMRVVRHNNGYVQTVFRAVIMQAAVQHNLPGPVRQHATVLGHERNEMRPGVTLNVR